MCLCNLGHVEKEEEEDLKKELVEEGVVGKVYITLRMLSLYLFVGVVHVKEGQMIPIYVCELCLCFVSLECECNGRDQISDGSDVY
jgi:hypothetical protein